MYRQAPLKRPHASWLIAAMSSGLVAGTALAVLPFAKQGLSPLLLLPATLATVMAWRSRSAGSLVLLLAAGTVVGLWHGGRVQAGLQKYEAYIGQTVTITGRVSEDPGHGKGEELRLQLTHINLDKHHIPGKVWASTTTNYTVKRNDTITLEGKLEPGFGNLSASMREAHVARLQATSRQDTALTVRDRFAEAIRLAIPEPQASLGSGFLTGQHSALPGNLEDQLKVVGLTHAVVASGSNLTILVGAMRRLFLRVSKYTATMAGGLMTASFVLIAGFSPSMTRAGLVTGLSLAAWYYGRRIHPLVLLPFAAAITIAINPTYIWGDIGWYLSFSAFAGVMILAPLMQRYFWGPDYKPSIVMEIFIGTTAAQLATMPVILYSFGTYSSFALAANMLVLPLVPLAMLLTFISGLAGLLVPSLAPVIGWPATVIMQYMTSVIDYIARLPGAQGTINYGMITLLTSYAVLIAGCIYMYRVCRFNFRNTPDTVIGERS